MTEGQTALGSTFFQDLFDIAKGCDVERLRKLLTFPSSPLSSIRIDINKKDGIGQSAGHIAIHSCKQRDSTRDRDESLSSTLKMLLEAGLDPNRKDACGFSLLTKAAEVGALDAVQLLLQT